MRTVVAVLAVVGLGAHPYQVGYTPYVSVALYGAGYAAEPQNPPQPQQQQGDVFRRLDSIEKKLDSLIALLNKLFEEDDRPAPQAAGGDPWLTGLSKCADCHGPDTAGKDGDGYVMFDKDRQKDGVFNLKNPLPLRNKAAKHVRERTMPPPENRKQVPPLTDAERSALLERLAK